MKNKKGFTLIELMIVMCIMFILIAIALPGIRGVLESNQEVEVQEMVVDENLDPVEKQENDEGPRKL